MKKANITSRLSLILCLVLIAAMALLTIGCTDNTQESPETPDGTTGTVAITTVDTNSEVSTQISATDITVKGEGETMFYFNVIDKDGNVTKFQIKTNETKVGAALIAVDLIDGEDGAYGLYVKQVNGITADYDTDGTWWEFCVGDSASMTGVDLTDITPGETYTFRVSK